MSNRKADRKAIIGARMFSPPSRLGMVINYSSSTLPGWMKDRLKSFGEGMWHFKERRDGRGTTTSMQTYVDNVRSVDALLMEVTGLIGQIRVAA